MRATWEVLSLAVLAVLLGAVAGGAGGQGPANCKAGDCPHAAKKKGGKSAAPKIEKLACKLGTEDEHARIAVELRDGRVNRFAYYSKWKPRTCSMEVERGDSYSNWVDTGDVTVVTLIEDKGAFLIDNERNRFHFIFREIDRMRYCGMDGKVSGSLTIFRGREQCELEGVMDRDGDAHEKSKVVAQPPQPPQPLQPPQPSQAQQPVQPPASAVEIRKPAAATEPERKLEGATGQGGDAKDKVVAPPPQAPQPAQPPASAVEIRKPAASTEPEKKPEGVPGRDGDAKDKVVAPPPQAPQPAQLPASAVETRKPAASTEPEKKPEGVPGRDGVAKDKDKVVAPPPQPPQPQQPPAIVEEIKR